MDTTLGKRITMLRRGKGLRQEDIAEMLEISPQAVSKWENDQTCPDISLLPRLARIFGVSVDELLTGKRAQPAVALVPLEERKGMGEMMLRIAIDSADGDKVKVNLPVALIQAAVDAGMEMPGLKGSDALKGVDMQKIMELVRQGVVGNLVEVETGGDTVRIFVE